jgi:hypothetical protein
MEGKGVFTWADGGTETAAGRSHEVNAGDVCDCVWKADRRHGACRYTFFNGEVYACTFVDGVCAEFDARQAAVRAAPDAASVQARAEGYASAAAKAEAQAAAKAEAIAAASAKAPRTVELLLRLDMQDHIPSFMSARLAPCFPCRVEPPTRLLSYSDARFTRKAKVTDAILAHLTDQQLKELGLEVGEVASFKMNVSAAALQPLTLAAGGGGGGGGGIAVVTTTTSSLSLSAPRTLASSNFKREHALKESPELQHELFSSMHSFITLMCVRHQQPAAAGKDLFLRLQGESFENPKELLSEIQVAATRIWTSTQKLQGAGVDKEFNVEFCSLLNRARREDDAELMPHLVVIVRAINALCIVRRESASLKFPPNAVSHRGGALPPQHHAFFAVGCQYRVPMYLATSFSADTASV